jgi:peptide-methionine (S)-S-oxide reductase
MAVETTTLGGGCFWCLDAAFRGIRGVESVICGYAGGVKDNPSYREVCGGGTGHAEVVQLRFDADQIDFATLLEIFFTIHDPTTLNRQGADVGSQYRSVIFYHSDAQLGTAQQTIAALTSEGVWPDPIVTEVAPAPTFYPAEDDHQDYFRRHPLQGYCQVVIAPKLAKLRARHASLLDA